MKAATATETPIDAKILQSIRANRSTSVFSPGHFAHLGSPTAVRKALSRLVKASKLRRVRQGLYDLPRQHPIIGQTAPDVEGTVRALMHGSHARWQFSGAYAANALGLTEQVPSKIVILTDGVPRDVQLGKLTLVFRRAAPRYLLGAGRPAGMVIQALRYLKTSAGSPETIARLRSVLDHPTKTDLATLTPKLPAWMQPIVQQIKNK
ncbi:MAG TPA: DUF6088 family protein [Chthoniobacterales bacterium]|jgi:hypothetical protein|nr:DUF6088 family protein [Chthoniobacterales bacterium]